MMSYIEGVDFDGFGNDVDVVLIVMVMSYIEGVDGHHLYNALRGKESIPECHLSKWERRKLVTRKIQLIGAGGILTGSAPARFAGIPGIAVSSLKTLTGHFFACLFGLFDLKKSSSCFS